MKQLNSFAVTLCLSGLFFLLVVSASPVSADVRLPHIIGSNMVVQRDIPIPIWGWADPGEVVKVTFQKFEASTKADEKGKWMVKLPAVKAGGPYIMTITGKNSIKLNNILGGEVWLCSGEYNMWWPVTYSNNSDKEIAEANYPQIRLLTVPNIAAGEPTDDINAVWNPCTPATIPNFSAVLYFFGREIHKQLNVPVGLINSSWGGTGIDVWTSADGFAAVPTFKNVTKQIKDAELEYKKIIADSLVPIENWINVTQKAIEENTPIPPAPNWPRHPLHNIGHPVKPTILYNAMIHPLVPFAIRGVIWYQGEANYSDGSIYYDKTKALVTGWRKAWNQGDFPFYYVQVAPLDYSVQKLSPQALPKLWEAQTAAMAIPNTGMAVTTDISDINEMHPRNKQDVGKRLALWAFAKTYGLPNIVFSGPIYKSMSIEGDKIRIRFDYAGSGLTSRDDKPLNWFEIAGDDKKFVKAQAKIDGDTVVVYSDTVISPVAVRFGWLQTAQPNLINKERLPASPFRTDNW